MRRGLLGRPGGAAGNLRSRATLASEHVGSVCLTVRLGCGSEKEHIVPEGSFVSGDLVLIPSRLCFPSDPKLLPASY